MITDYFSQPLRPLLASFEICGCSREVDVGYQIPGIDTFKSFLRGKPGTGTSSGSSPNRENLDGIWMFKWASRLGLHHR